MAKSNSEKDSDKRIMRLFRGRCVVNPAHRATEINEIVLRSRTKGAIDMPNNRVPMCHSCHHIYHWGGVTEQKQEKLRESAIIRLTALGVSIDEW